MREFRYSHLQTVFFTVLLVTLAMRETGYAQAKPVPLRMGGRMMPKTGAKRVMPRDKKGMMFQEVAVGLSNYKSKCGSYPNTSEGLKALKEKPAGSSCSDYPEAGFVAQSEPKDNWDHAFVYKSDGQHYELISLGADGKEGGTGDDMDVRVTD